MNHAERPKTDPSRNTLKRPEVLAPAGDLTALRAAISAGADAVYFGIDGLFNARAKSDGISSDTLDEVVNLCHHAGVKALVTVNTLIFEGELSRVALLIQRAAEAGVDALIVQDPGVALLAREIAPTMEVHASTQMTISSPEAGRFAAGLGVTRVVVPRELTVSQIKTFKAHTDLELEVFIHGALCMSWSGQCLTSEAWGGRSANRGQCAQSCRMPYDLIVDGEERPLGEIKYLLSPRDLAGVRAVESLVEMGIECLKIEGRYKGPAYVKQSVEMYQSWINAVVSGECAESIPQRELADHLTGLSLAYSRGFSDGFLGGSDHQSLVEGRFPKHRGVFLGYVVEISDEWIRLSSRGDGRRYNQQARGLRSDPLPLYESGVEEDTSELIEGGEAQRERGPLLSKLSAEAGMGVVFDQGTPEKEEFGGRLAEVRYEGDEVSIRLYQPNRDLALKTLRSRVNVGQRVWVNHDPKLNQRATKEAEQVAKKTGLGRLTLDLIVSGQVDSPLTVSATVRSPIARYNQLTVKLETEQSLALNIDRPLDESVLRDKLGALGGTPFSLGELRLHIHGSCGLAVSSLKRLRRSLVEELISEMRERRAHTVHKDALTASRALQVQRLNGARPPLDTPQLVPLCRTMEQLEAVITCAQEGHAHWGAIEEVELDWMEFVGLRQAVERARGAGLKVTIATVRVQKPGESGYDRRIETLKPDGVLIRHWGALTYFAAIPLEERPVLHGDFSLNLTNSLSAAHVLDYGLDSITAAHDLDSGQLLALLKGVPPSSVAVTIHHHIPTFHTEHCVYAHLLSDGRDYKTCGRPCEAHRVALRDHKGKAHPVLVDVECRNTVFNASAQTAASLASSLVNAKVGRLRLEFVWEDTTQTQRVISAYQALLRREIDASELLKRVGVHEQFGLTSGTMEVSQ